MHELLRLYAGYSDNKANSAQFQLGYGLSIAIDVYVSSDECECVFHDTFKIFKM